MHAPCQFAKTSPENRAAGFAEGLRAAQAEGFRITACKNRNALQFLGLSTDSRRRSFMNKAPKHFNRLRERFPAYMESLEQLGETARTQGPLDDRTCQLLQLAAAAASRSEGAVHSHARRALAAGSTMDELHHALICLTSTIGFPAVSAAMSWLDDLE
jgi:4-carboxymuconolactone decarboxylase